MIMINSIFKKELLESLALRICLQIHTHILESACYLNSLPQIKVFLLGCSCCILRHLWKHQVFIHRLQCYKLGPLHSHAGRFTRRNCRCPVLLLLSFLLLCPFYLSSFIYPSQPKWTVCLSHRQICRKLRMWFLLAVFCSWLGAGPQTTLYFPTSWPNRILLLSIDIAVFIERILAVLLRGILEVV